MRHSAREEKRRKRNNIIVGLVLAFLMVFSILAIAIDGSQNQDNLVFNDVEFKQKVVFDNQIYMQDIYKFYFDFEDEEVQLFFSPYEASRVNVSAENLSLKDASLVSFSRSPISEEFEFTVKLLFFDVLVSEFNEYSFKSVGYGLTEHTVFESERGIINCDSASSATPVFILSDDVGASAINEISPYCYEIVGDNEDLLRISDYLLLKAHGLI